MTRLSRRRAPSPYVTFRRFVRGYGWVITGLALLAALGAAPFTSSTMSQLGFDVASIRWVVPAF